MRKLILLMRTEAAHHGYKRVNIARWQLVVRLTEDGTTRSTFGFREMLRVVVDRTVLVDVHCVVT